MDRGEGDQMHIHYEFTLIKSTQIQPVNPIIGNIGFMISAIMPWYSSVPMTYFKEAVSEGVFADQGHSEPVRFQFTNHNDYKIKLKLHGLASMSHSSPESRRLNIRMDDSFPWAPADALTSQFTVTGDSQKDFEGWVEIPAGGSIDLPLLWYDCYDWGMWTNNEQILEMASDIGDYITLSSTIVQSLLSGKISYMMIVDVALDFFSNWLPAILNFQGRFTQQTSVNTVVSEAFADTNKNGIFEAISSEMFSSEAELTTLLYRPPTFDSAMTWSVTMDQKFWAVFGLICEIISDICGYITEVLTSQLKSHPTWQVVLAWVFSLASMVGFDKLKWMGIEQAQFDPVDLEYDQIASSLDYPVLEIPSDIIGFQIDNDLETYFNSIIEQTIASQDLMQQYFVTMDRANTAHQYHDFQAEAMQINHSIELSEQIIGMEQQRKELAGNFYESIDILGIFQETDLINKDILRDLQNNGGLCDFREWYFDYCILTADLSPDDIFDSDWLEIQQTKYYSINIDEFWDGIALLGQGLDQATEGVSAGFDTIIDRNVLRLVELNVNTLMVVPTTVSTESFSRLQNILEEAELHLSAKSFDLAYTKAKEAKQLTRLLMVETNNLDLLRPYLFRASDIMIIALNKQQLRINLLGSSEGVILPGNTWTSSFILKNVKTSFFSGEESLSIDLSTGSLPSGWTVTFFCEGKEITNVELAPGEQKIIRAVFFIPEGYSGEDLTFHLSIQMRADMISDYLTSRIDYSILVLDDDDSGPVITTNIIGYELGETGNIGVIIDVSAVDLESGIDLTSIKIVVNDQEFTTLGTHIFTFDAVGVYQLTATVSNNDLDHDRGDQETTIETLDFTISLSVVIEAIKVGINDLIWSLQHSSDSIWEKPNRRHPMDEKLAELINLIDTKEYSNAYDKLLHDIKPKLTGLKTDENECPWGNGVIGNPWIIDEECQEYYKLHINPLLKGIIGFLV
ncbi:MAG: hypothetical protein GYA24_17335 [Candidatus Lokiarchaeota archaeon]|nr:hypothetical protein [Candidatus Lokiarchaeota archaeon]